MKVAEESPRSPWEASHCAPGIKVWGIKRKQGVGATVVTRRLLAPLCRVDVEGKWLWLKDEWEAQQDRGGGQQGTQWERENG